MVVQPRQESLSPEIELWERQPGENDRSWGCFELYRDLHPSVRSLAKAYIEFKRNDLDDADWARPSTDCTRPGLLIAAAPHWFENLGVRWQWTIRVRAYDEWRDLDTLTRLQSTRVRHLVSVAGIGRQLQLVAAQALTHLQVVRHELILDADGNPQTIEVSALSPAAIVQLIKAGAELEGGALGLGGRGAAGQGVTVQIANVMNAARDDSQALPTGDTDDELLLRVAEIVASRTAGEEPTVKPLTVMVETAARATARVLPNARTKPKGKAKAKRPQQRPRSARPGELGVKSPPSRRGRPVDTTSPEVAQTSRQGRGVKE